MILHIDSTSRACHIVAMLVHTGDAGVSKKGNDTYATDEHRVQRASRVRVFRRCTLPTGYGPLELVEGKGVPSAPNHDSHGDSARVVQSNLPARSLYRRLRCAASFGFWRYRSRRARGASGGCSLDFDSVGRQLFLSKEESCGVEERLLCSATPQEKESNQC
jgi:hypothetical protein